MRFGYTLMTEQRAPRDLVQDAVGAERAGFDVEVISDHYFPWLDAQGHAPYAWSVLGAVAVATERVELATYVTCPTFRYHPAVVAQKAATVSLLSEGRFLLGLGAGENLNEHIVGGGWPGVDIRHERLVEAVTIIKDLLAGGYVSFRGDHFQVDSAKLWDLPEHPLPIGVAVSGPQSCATFAPLADFMVAVTPEAELGRMWDAASGKPTARKVGQVPISWGSDADAALQRAHQQFRWFGGGWKVNAELPGTAAFDAASSSVRPEDVAASIPCGDDVSAVVEACRPYWEAGFTDLALIQVGGDQQASFLEAAPDLLSALREAAPAASKEAA